MFLAFCCCLKQFPVRKRKTKAEMKLEKCSSKQNTATRFSITIVFCAMSIRYVVSPVSINLITIWSSARSLELDLFFQRQYPFRGNYKWFQHSHNWTVTMFGGTRIVAGSYFIGLKRGVHVTAKPNSKE